MAVNPFTADPVEALHFTMLVKPTMLLIFDIRALWRSGLSAIGYGAEPFEQQRSGTAGVKRVKWAFVSNLLHRNKCWAGKCNSGAVGQSIA